MKRGPHGSNSDRPVALPPGPAEPHFPHAEHVEPPIGVKRVLKVASSVIGTGVVLVATTALGAVLHVGLPPARRLTAAAVNQLLAGTFRGKIVVDRVGRLAPIRVDDVDATLFGPDGKRLAHVDGLRARLSFPPLLWSLLSKGDLRIVVSDLAIDHLDVLLEQRPDGSLPIAEAFQPATEGPPPPPKSSSSGLGLSLSRITLRHAWVHGSTVAVPTIDADLDDLAGAFGLTPERTSADVRRLRLSTRGLPMHADVAAALEAHLVIPALDPSGHTDGSVSFVGTVGGVGLRVAGSIGGKEVNAVVDAPQVLPAQLASMLGSAPIHQDASLHVEVQGTLPEIDPVVHVGVGKGTIDVHGHVTLPGEGQPDTVASLALTARDLDLRAASLTAPASKLGLDTTVTARLAAEGAVEGAYEAHVLPGVVGPQPTPDVQLAGRFTKTEIDGKARIAERGAPAMVAFLVRPFIRGGPEVAFDASAHTTDLARIPAIGGQLHGDVAARVTGQIALGTKQVQATAQVVVTKLAAGPVAVDRAQVTAKVLGTLEAPVFAAGVSGTGLRAASYSFPSFGLGATGSPSEVAISGALRGEGAPTVTMRAKLRAKTGIDARDVAITVQRDADTVTASAAAVRSRGGRLDVEGIRLEGAGEPLTGDVHVRAGEIAARVSAPGLDVPTLLRIAGQKSSVESGRVGLDVDVTATRRATNGHANVTVRHATYKSLVTKLDADVSSTFSGRSVEAHVKVHDAKVGDIALDTNGATLAGGVLDPRAFLRATGRAHASANVDLERTFKSSPVDVPLEYLRGWLKANVDVTRADASRRPTITLQAATKDLSFTTQPETVPNGDGTVTIVGFPFHSEGLDAKVNATLDGETGATTFDGALHDTVGGLLTLTVSTKLPIPALLAGDAKSALLATPMKVHAEVPSRSLDSLPRVLGTVPVHGDASVALDVTGSAQRPNVSLLVHGQNITDAEDSTPIPIGVDAKVTYDGEQGRAQLTVTRPSGAVLDATGVMRMRFADVLAGAGAPPWDASAEMKLSKFPVGAVTSFFEDGIDGDLSGTISVQDLHKAGKLDVHVDLENGNVGGAPLPRANALVSVRDGTLSAKVHLEQPDGFADAQASGGVVWGADVAPAIDAAKPIDLGLHAKNFRAALLAPFVHGAVSELDGRVNADTKLRVDPGMKNGKMVGAILVDKGLFETPALGEEFHNLRARIFMKPWGVWNVEELSADGTSGHFTAKASAHVEGLKLRSADAHLTIAEKDKLPLTMEGMPLGTAWGQVDAKASVAESGAIAIDVNVPKLHVALPDSTPNAVQSTDPDATIKVGVHVKGGKMAILAVDGALPLPKPPEPKPPPKPGEKPTTLRLVTHLGPDVEIKRGTMLKAEVSGGPTIVVGDKTTLSGQVSVPRGYIELQGKRFQIQKGTVNFTGQPSDDPVVIATAAYESPDGTTVFADFVGPVKTGKLTLRSEPELSQNEILALLLFGTADGTFGQAAPPGQGGNTGTQAASLAGGIVTEGLNKAISGVSGVEVQTKVDTGESGDPRPEVELALTRDVSATVIYNLGVPPPGQNPDDTLLVVDWRFYKGYSTEATLGDKGTSIVDLTWKYRY